MRRIPACFTLLAGLALGCGDKDSASGEAATSDGSTSEAATSDGSTSDGSTSDGSTTGVSCPVSSVAQCGAVKLCPEVDTADRPDTSTYAEAELCAFEALRERTPGLVEYNECGNTGCSSAALLVLPDGRVYASFASFDAEVGTSNVASPRPCEIPEPAYFEACLAAFDASCVWSQYISECRADESACACP